MRAETGKSVPVLKEFLVEAMVAPLTPEKPTISGERPIYQNEQALSSQDCIMAEKEEYLSRFTEQIPRGEMPRVSEQEYLSGFAGGAPVSGPPTRFCESMSSSSSSSVHQESFLGCRDSMMGGRNPSLQWRSMTFMDLLMLNGGTQLSSGFLSDLDYRSALTDSVSENQESIGLQGSNQDISRILENGVHPNGSNYGFMHAFAPATPDLSKRLQNREGSHLSVVDDLLGINGGQPPTDSVAMENYDPTKGGNPDLDLNKAIEQKPRRKKHRPKVVREVKPKQTPKERKPKPVDADGTPKERKSKPVDADGTPRQKRKYVRKNKTNMPTTTPPEKGTEVLLDGKIPDPGVKSCRKALSFDLEDQVKEKKPTDANGTPKRKRKYVPKNKTNIPSTPPLEVGADTLDCKTPDPAVKSCRKALSFDMEDQAKENNFSPTSTDNPPSEQLTQDLYPRKEKVVTMGGTEEYSAYDIFRNNQTLNGYMLMSEQEAQSTHPTKEAEHEFPAATEVMPPRDFFACSPNLSTCTSSSEGGHMRCLKRANSYSADASNVGTENLMGHSTPAQATCTSMGNAISSFTHGMYFPEIHKKRKSETVLVPNTLDILSSRNAVEDTRAETSSQNYPREAAKTSKYYYSLLAPHFNISAEGNSQASATTNHQDIAPFINWGDIDLLKIRSKDTTCVGELDLLKGFEKSKKTSRSPAKRRGKGTQKKIVKACHTSCMEDTRKSMKKTPGAKSITSGFNMVNKQSIYLYNGQHLTGNSNSPYLALPWIDTNSVSVQYQEQGTLIPYHAQTQQLNSLVLYQRDRVVVPFEGTISQKRRPRAKVDLDDETNRVWSLLLEDINNQGIDGTDEEKKKWWEEERNVFRGRVDSFIARMRLVQGDRRFSPWKGSVVDSVVGVFLTQNVSDHLSSSAFMSVAARYPLKSTNKDRTDSEEEIDSSVKEQEICIVEFDDNIDTVALNEKAVEDPVCDRNSRTLHDIDVREEKVADSNESHDFTNMTDDTWYLSHSSHGKPHESQLYTSSIKELGIPSTPMVDRAIDDVAVDDVTSSQHSVISSQNSSGVQTSRKRDPGSNSSSEGEGLTHTANPSSVHSKSFVELLKMAETPMLNTAYTPKDQVPSYQSDLPNPSQKLFTTELMSNFSDAQNKCSAICQPQSVEEYHLQAVDEESRSVNSTSLGENTTTEPSKATAESEESAIESHLHKEASISNMGPSLPFDNVCSRYVLEGEEMVFHSLTEKPIPLQMNTKLPTVSRDNVTPASTCASNSTIYNELIPNPPLSDHNHSLGEAHNMLKQDAINQKTGKNPTKAPYDWDILRRQAQANGSTTRERPTSTMDSVNWEAVRCADVSDIAETIKERGMNNRLAARIQDFLNRIVNDHGNIDLEWLRDVPPDKAKEYLLSVKGLGLKSVECVRLLTLHHLAFPVDTNVGRIAVRLGWVPLQPLPESLQLHLLEMYPILESIQKYLWPRLCKLDQRTLYELHYHMITFGKVFCTKRQPNCNACPLRGECRHFASAFASARLALPGPQDRSIVLSEQSNPTQQDPQVTFNSLPLPLPMTDQILEIKSDAKNCEPIVEIPASPEPEPEQIQECDIEDAFSEDPNEIPTIKLDMEEFTQTLQAYMQSNKDLQEGDMSKALVALAAEAASIPTPKLKNVSRLRTEHHVYELPDTHQLIRGLDKREPDDPSPYLLAIWTPGETANSIEPPQKRCDFQEPGELCNDETCCYCNSQREANTQVVRGTLLIPCRTAMRGSFPLNGTYFQVNEVFADHDSSLNPIQVPRTLLWNLPRRTVYFGSSIPTIFKGLSTEGIQHCFWRGYVCVRGFDQKTRAPRPLMARLHISAFKMAKARANS